MGATMVWWWLLACAGSPDGGGRDVGSTGAAASTTDSATAPTPTTDPGTTDPTPDPAETGDTASAPEPPPYPCPPADGFVLDERFTSSIWNPCLLDPAAETLCFPGEDTHERGKRLHRVRFRNDLPLRDTLFVYLPPAEGSHNGDIVSWAAYVGYPTISLGWINDTVLQGPCAGPDADPTCFGRAREEILYGEDLSDEVDVPPADAVVTRLRTVVAHLVDAHPEVDWGRYLTDDGLAWDRIVVGGWSRGSACAAMLGRDETLAGLVLLSGPQEPVGNPPQHADWLLEPRATPGCRTQSVWHTDENHIMLEDVLDLFGVPPGVMDVDTDPPPWSTHRLTTSVYDPPKPDICNHHRAMGMDACMSASMLPLYVHAFCRADALCE